MNGPSHPWQLTILEAASLLRSRALSSVELLDSVLERAAETEPSVHAWVLIDAEQAGEAARSCDNDLVKGETRGPLHGIPVGVKDIFDVRGLPTRCGSRSRQEAPAATEDAVVVRQLRDSGAILLGKTVTQEFAAGVVSDPARNPWNPDRIPGGSSGGTAASIVAGSSLAGLGSDTGGSIRIPAAMCGVVGFKPTFGALSTGGVFPLSWSLDTVGPLTRTVDDATLMYRVMQTGEGRSKPAPRSAPLRVGIPRPHFFDRLQPGVASAMALAIESLGQAGIEVIETPWAEASAARAASFIINRVETVGVHIGDLAEQWDGYGEELRLRIESSTLVPAYAYVKAHQARGIIARSCARVFDEHELDAMITPASPGTAAPADDVRVVYDDGSREHVGMAYTRFTMPFNATGQPALSIPCGFDDLGLPVGLQIAGRPNKDEALLSAGRRIEDAIGFGPQFPGNLSVQE
ncbi:MAG: amidase [Thermomicrobiales bacterium]|nr:amidase [Thermomicrobiales bacterium]